MSDFVLLAGLRQRDPAALEKAIHQYAPYVSAVISKTLGQFRRQEDVEELVSDVFVILWEKSEKLRDDSSLKYWLAVVARNAALRFLRCKKLELPLEENLLCEEGDSVFFSLEKAEQNSQVRRAVESLPPEDRTIFLRHYFWHQTVSDISREMDKKESTVKSRLKRGREKLRRLLQKEECLK